MTDSIKIVDTTVEKAIQKGLRQLGVKENEVTVTIVREGKKGLFGFGKQDAIVEMSVMPSFETKQPEDIVKVEATSVTISEYQEDVEDATFVEEDIEESPSNVEEKNYEQEYSEVIDIASNYLKEVAHVYGAPVEVEVEIAKEQLVFRLESEKAGLLIGKHGKILNALQILTQTIVHRYITGRMSVLVDVENYREHRSEMLKQIAERTASKVLRTKQPVFLEPLPAYERKQIHAYLSKNKRISTHSEGKEPHRYLVVELAK